MWAPIKSDWITYWRLEVNSVCFIYSEMCRSWQCQGRPLHSLSLLRKFLWMLVTMTKIRHCWSSTRMGFKSCKRSTLFSASRAWGYYPKRSPNGLHATNLSNSCPQHQQLSSPMDTGLEHPCSMFPSTTSTRKSSLSKMRIHQTGALIEPQSTMNLKPSWLETLTLSASVCHMFFICNENHRFKAWAGYI
jgi:hypothetical protein